MIKITTKIELQIGEVMHELTIEELRELHKVIGSVIDEQRKSKQDDSLAELRKKLKDIGPVNPPPYKPYGEPISPWIDRNKDSIYPPYVVYCSGMQ